MTSFSPYTGSGFLHQTLSPVSTSFPSIFPTTTVSGYSSPLSYGGGYVQSGPVQSSAAVVQAASIYPGPIGVQRQDAPDTVIPAELCLQYGIPIGSRWGSSGAASPAGEL